MNLSLWRLRLVCLNFLLLGLVWFAFAEEGNMRCGSAIVRDGMKRAEVREKCGEPTDQSSRFVLKYLKQSEKQIDERNEQQVEEAIEKGTVERVEIEEWFYNFGPNRMTRTVVFESGNLIRIETGGKGY